MAKYLVIVESPAKVKTVKKYLGANYEVAASMGHVRDLPKSRLGIDVEHDFEPKYITIRGKGELLASLRKAAKKADKVYLATDPDREGEAISWHLSIALNLDENKMRRITFNEITKSAVKASIKQARDIDMNLVDEQQARRCLDRMVGYEISPLLWKKIKRGLSAGRVQSVALRIIGDREDEINAFIPKEYWTLEADLKIPGEKKPLVAKFHGKGSEKMAIETKEQLDEILKGLENDLYRIRSEKRRAFQESAASVHHEYPAAGSIEGAELLHTEDDASGAAALRGRGSKRKGNDRSDFLSAYRFYTNQRGGRCGSTFLYPGAVRHKIYRKRGHDGE